MEVPPFRDALRDVEDDEPLDEPPRSNLASVVVPKVEHRRTIDAVCPLDSKDFALPKVSLLHFHASRLSRHV